MFTLTVYKDSSSRSIVNLYDLVNFETLDAAIELAQLYNLPYTIKETSTEKITDLNYINDDSNSNVEYFVCSDCENWTDYYFPYYFPHKSFNEARDIALKCIEKEHCRAYIEKHFEKTVVEVY